MSTVKTPSIATATLYIDSVQVVQQTIDTIVSGDSKPVALSFSNIDPFSIYSKASQYSVIVTMNGKTMDQATGSIASADRLSDLVTYFSHLVNGSGYVPTSVDRNQRIGDVKDTIENLNTAEVLAHARVGNGNPWKANPSSTVAGKLLDSIHASAQSDWLAPLMTRSPTRFGLPVRIFTKFSSFSHRGEQGTIRRSCSS